MQASLDIFNHILTNIFYFQLLQASGAVIMAYLMLPEGAFINGIIVFALMIYYFL